MTVRAAIACTMVLSCAACSLELGGLGTTELDGGAAMDGGEPRDADRGTVDARTPPGDDGGSDDDDAGAPGDDAGSPRDAGPPPGMDAGEVDAGGPPGVELWSRLGPDYDPSDFRYTANMHFEGGEIHVPSFCRDLEMVTIAEPSSSGWVDYEVSVTRIRFDAADCGSNPSFTIVARTRSRDPTCAGATGYACSIDFARDQIHAGRRNTGCNWVTGERATASAGSINTAPAAYSLTLQVQDSRVTCIIDNGGTIHRVSYTDSARTFRMGGVAFIFDDVDARFGDPTVTSL